jgi:hypothetical protein
VTEFPHLTGLGLKDWLAIYAAILSSITAVFQVVKARSDGPRVRIKVFREKSSDGLRRFIQVRVANVGSRAIVLQHPELEVAQQSNQRSRIGFIEPDDIYDDSGGEWEPVDASGPVTLFQLNETHAETFRWRPSSASVPLSIRVLDRAGGTRIRHHFLVSPWRRARFWLKHLWRKMPFISKGQSRTPAA